MIKTELTEDEINFLLLDNQIKQERLSIARSNLLIEQAGLKQTLLQLQNKSEILCEPTIQSKIKTSKNFWANLTNIIIES